MASFLSFAFVKTLYASPNFTNVIIFGDSLSDSGNPEALPPEKKDMGNNDWVKTDAKIGAPVTNLDQLSQAHLMWVNYFVKKYFISKPVYPVSHMALLGLDASKNNINYAWASAETGAHYINDVSNLPLPYDPYNDEKCNAHGPGLIDATNSCVPGVLLQIDTYLKDVNQRINPNTLFIIWAGGNDLFNNIAKLFAETKPTPENISHLTAMLLAYLTEDKSKPNENPVFSKPIAQLVAAKNNLILAGASPDQIYVIDLPDISKSPAALAMAKGNPKLLMFFSIISNAFNTGLRFALSHPLQNKYSMPISHIFSSNDLLNKVIHHPADFGLTNVNESCVEKKALPYCEGYLFFDDKHPTTRMHAIMAEAFIQYLKV